MNRILFVTKEILRILLFSVLGFVFLMLIINLPLFFTKKNSLKIEVSEGESVAVSNTAKLYIPKIDIEAPIIFPKKISEVEPQLSHGVVHYPNTALPGKKGNVFITGHSSDYPWKSGAYKQVFLFLTKVEQGDIIYIDYQGKRLRYKVYEKKIIQADNREVLKEIPGKNSLTLMTCYPPNTVLKRLVVVAEEF